MKNTAYCYVRSILFFLGAWLIVACGSPKDTVLSRGVQNLTARYNYIYNSNLILGNYEEQLYESYLDNYNELLPVYTTPEKFNFSTLNTPLNEHELDKIIAKARIIIADKSHSNYIKEAYMLLGRAYYYKGNYFVAKEYFDYTGQTYATHTDVRREALNWQARTLLQLNNLSAAARVVDTLYQNLPANGKNQAEPLATTAQLYIYQKRYADAIPLLTQAAKTTSLKRNRIRWTYILAQLAEHQKDYTTALSHYQRVQKSNGSFQMYFNANLNRIKLSALLRDEHLNQEKTLLALLKDDKNQEYADQVYYRIAEDYAGDANFGLAEKYYNLSISNSSNNNIQKGLSYLKLANMNFKDFRNFLKAKAYFDSTVNTLPKTYPGYALILKKTENLEYISKRYDAIAWQDTLQSLAKLSAEERLAKIGQIRQFQNSFQPSEILAAPSFTGSTHFSTASSNEPGAFYFSNAAAMSSGTTDFRRRWGNRILEDDWRQSHKSSAEITTEIIAKAEEGAAPATLNPIMPKIPLSPAELSTSNQLIIDAYYEIAGFYQQELLDQAEALRIYELLLTRFPENNHRAAIYYSLYLGYKNDNAAAAERYRKMVIDQFPESSYAKTILDPEYTVKQSALDSRMRGTYNQIFNSYEKKAFTEVITAVDNSLAEFPDHSLNPQLSYLRSISIGRTQRIGSLVAAFNAVIKTYPEDQLIVPLVKKHLTYIATYKDIFNKRNIALPDFDQNEPLLFHSAPSGSADSEMHLDKATLSPQIETGLHQSTTLTDPLTEGSEASLFSATVSTIYYYVIDVEDASIRLSSSRFGIGQFNRGNHADSDLKHRLIEFDNDQLVYIGNFSSFAEAKEYAEGINPQLKQIMKVPAGTYSSFIISKENFEKLQNKERVSKYLDFYKKTYQNE